MQGFNFPKILGSLDPHLWKQVLSKKGWHSDLEVLQTNVMMWAIILGVILLLLSLIFCIVLLNRNAKHIDTPSETLIRGHETMHLH